MSDNRQRRIKTWKEEAIAIFSMMLKECEEAEAYEQCAMIKANMEYIDSVPLTIKEDELDIPFPYRMLEDDESIFLDFLDREDNEGTN